MRYTLLIAALFTGCAAAEPEPDPAPPARRFHAPIPLAGRTEEGPGGRLVLALPVAPWTFRFSRSAAGVQWVVSVPEDTSTARLTGCHDSELGGVATGAPAYRARRFGYTLEESLAVEVPLDTFERFVRGSLEGRVCGQSWNLQTYQRNALESWLRASRAP